MRPYFNRYTEDAVDLCDVLSSFSHQGKATLHELCCLMGLPGKPDGMTGAEVEKYYRDGRIREVAEYCESDVVNTYRVWLRYELFRGRLSASDFQTSEASLANFIRKRANARSQSIGSEPVLRATANEIDPHVQGTSGKIESPVLGPPNEIAG